MEYNHRVKAAHTSIGGNFGLWEKNKTALTVSQL